MRFFSHFLSSLPIFCRFVILILPVLTCLVNSHGMSLPLYYIAMNNYCSRRIIATTLSDLRTVCFALTSATMDGGAREFAHGCATEAKKG